MTRDTCALFQQQKQKCATLESALQQMEHSSQLYTHKIDIVQKYSDIVIEENKQLKTQIQENNQLSKTVQQKLKSIMKELENTYSNINEETISILDSHIEQLLKTLNVSPTEDATLFYTHRVTKKNQNDELSLLREKESSHNSELAVLKDVIKAEKDENTILRSQLQQLAEPKNQVIASQPIINKKLKALCDYIVKTTANSLYGLRTHAINIRNDSKNIGALIDSIGQLELEISKWRRNVGEILQ